MSGFRSTEKEITDNVIAVFTGKPADWPFEAGF